MTIQISSKRDGFRRCAVEHSSAPTIYPNDRFTEEQLAQLQAEPMLIVTILPDESEAEEGAGDTISSELEALRLKALELEIPKAMQLGKAKLLAAIAEKEAN